MKNFIILIFALIPFVSGCDTDDGVLADGNREYREAAWRSLSNNDRSTVIIDWKQAPVTESMYKGQHSKAVQFRTNVDVLGPITVHVDACSKKVLGQDLRD